MSGWMFTHDLIGDDPDYVMVDVADRYLGLKRPFWTRAEVLEALVVLDHLLFGSLRAIRFVNRDASALREDLIHALDMARRARCLTFGSTQLRERSVQIYWLRQALHILEHEKRIGRRIP